MYPARNLRTLALVALLPAFALACSDEADPSVFGSNELPAGPNDAGKAVVIEPSGGNTGSSSGTLADGGAANPGPGSGSVYAHSGHKLYRLDPTTKLFEKVATIDLGSDDIVTDIAIDGVLNAYITTMTSQFYIIVNGVPTPPIDGTYGFYKLDLSSGKATFISKGNYPNSLSFVPKGTLDPNEEALVGYFGSNYVRINTTTGAVTKIGALKGGYESSGDIVSVAGGGTFLTANVKAGCNDCLLQIDPKTGDMLKDFGSIGYPSVFGLTYWAGSLYGFSATGTMFQVSPQGTGIKTTLIPIPDSVLDPGRPGAPPYPIAFNGAGSTTAAPVADGQGNTIEIVIK